MNHTAECLTRQAEMKRLHDEYEKKWPHYCRKCNGAGEAVWQENQAPLGSGEVWLESLSEPCELCLAAGTCPRCGGPYRDKDCTEPCWICGWSFGDACPPAELEEPCECYFPIGEF